MGNTCKGILNKDHNNEVLFENQSFCEKETRIVLHFLLDKLVSKRIQKDQQTVTNQLSTIINSFENITEDNLKSLKDFQHLFVDLLRKSKERFTKLNIDYYGIFDFDSMLDRDESILSFTKELITNYYCHLISDNEHVLSRFI